MTKRKSTQNDPASALVRDDVVTALRAQLRKASEPRINVLVERVIELAQMTPEQTTERIDANEADNLLDIKELELAENSEPLLRPWKSIKRAAPRALSEAEYKRFLQDLDPIDEELEVYGASVK